MERGKMPRKKFRAKRNPKKKKHAEEGSHFGIKPL